MQYPAIICPPPPPTCNVLTYDQRHHLLRTTQKLSKVLGYTPQLIDCNYSVHTNHPPTPSHARMPSVSSAPYLPPSSPTPSTATSSSLSPLIRPGSRSSRRTHSPSSSVESQDAYHQPLLRLAVNVDSQPPPPAGTAKSLRRPSTAPSALSPLRTSLPPDLSAVSSHLLLVSSPAASASHSFSISVPRTRRPTSMALPTDAHHPQFIVPSDATLRRRKMERVCKRLGECVPVEVLFPAAETDVGEDPDDCKQSSDAGESGHRSHFAPNHTSLDAVYEYPDEHGEEGLTSTFAPSAPSRSKSWGSRLCRAIKFVNL